MYWESVVEVRRLIRSGDIGDCCIGLLLVDGDEGVEYYWGMGFWDGEYAKG